MAYQNGKHRGKVYGQKLSQNENTKNYQIILTFDVLGKVDPHNPTGDLLPCDEGQRSVFRSITEKTAQRIADELRALGFTGASFAQIDKEMAGDEYVDLTGRECDLICKHEEYNGRMQEKWELAVLGGGGANLGAPIEKKQVREIDAKFGKFLKSAGPAAAPVKRETVAAGAPDQSGDIPF